MSIKEELPEDHQPREQRGGGFLNSCTGIVHSFIHFIDFRQRSVMSRGERDLKDVGAIQQLLLPSGGT